MNLSIPTANFITVGDGGGKTAQKEDKTMDINIIWDNEELEAIEELNEIFNL